MGIVGCVPWFAFALCSLRLLIVGGVGVVAVSMFVAVAVGVGHGPGIVVVL